jgi:hypothetical protein
MSRAGAMVCVAALFLSTLSGCVLDSTSLNVFAVSNDNEKVISGSLESVTTSTTDHLRSMGVFVERKQEGETIRLSSCTKNGKRFTLVLISVKGSHGDQTRVRIEWIDEADVSFWLGLVELVATAPPEHDSK